MTIIELDTPRLRGWRELDREPFLKMNCSPEVMRYFPAVLNKEQSNQLMAAIMARFVSQGGWGLWAVELKSQNTFIGFTGLNIPTYALPC
ncbi:hypothetical protein OOA_08682 [Providencia burhodogranariea DSM 19968]|uniref:N-acetyltransferase domain-containing protein n=1 Tax=Providencia burhodogranariea DSM 19968 TaxID=1141662 RepID=K8WQS8_9GAMM|nr:hypothetical protein OOA_08682 [Providencia burhodogranariea DSM 19968]